MLFTYTHAIIQISVSPYLHISVIDTDGGGMCDQDNLNGPGCVIYILCSLFLQTYLSDSASPTHVIFSCYHWKCTSNPVIIRNLRHAPEDNDADNPHDIFRGNFPDSSNTAWGSWGYTSELFYSPSASKFWSPA